MYTLNNRVVRNQCNTLTIGISWLANGSNIQDRLDILKMKFYVWIRQHAPYKKLTTQGQTKVYKCFSKQPATCFKCLDMDRHKPTDLPIGIQSTIIHTTNGSCLAAPIVVQLNCFFVNIFLHSMSKLFTLTNLYAVKLVTNVSAQ